MDALPAIEVKDLVKNFRKVNIKGGYTSLKTVLLNPFAQYRKEGERVLKVLRGLDFRASQGEMVGLIGRNGSGKSTLLKIMAGIYRKTSGSVRLNGRVSALIELGAGFHPEFTGRENIFLYGIILGLSKNEVKRKFDEIVSFAELEDYIDSPVRTYSSGMYVRLGFSVAVNVNPEILLIDEVMAVGDAGFRRKCEDKILEFKQAGKTMVLVSHDLDEVERFCDRVTWLNEGVIQEDGQPSRVVETGSKVAVWANWPSVSSMSSLCASCSVPGAVSSPTERTTMSKRSWMSLSLLSTYRINRSWPSAAGSTLGTRERMKRTPCFSSASL